MALYTVEFDGPAQKMVDAANMSEANTKANAYWNSQGQKPGRIKSVKTGAIPVVNPSGLPEEPPPPEEPPAG